MEINVERLGTEVRKLRKFYGNINKRPFSNLFFQIKNMSNILGSSFSYLLESRLDVILFRVNLFNSIFTVRQLINHKHILINGRVVNKSSYQLSVGDIISIKKSFWQFYYSLFKKKIEENQLLINYPVYLEVNYKIGSIYFIKLPLLNEVSYPFVININLLIHNFLK